MGEMDMPPKFKFSREQIVGAALELVRKEGAQGMTARAVGQALGSSSKVIFSLFRNMEDLQKEVFKGAYTHYLSFLQQDMDSGKYPPYKAMGMAYIRFAIEERELFKFLFMREHSFPEQFNGPDFDLSVEMIQKANGISGDRAALLHTEMWVCVHGIATMHATSFLTLEEDLISRILTDTYFGLRHRHTIGEE